MELIVSLTISSLVIFSGLEFLSSWERLLSGRNTSMEESGGVLRFYDVLARDIKEGDKVISDADRIRITSGTKEVSYEFAERSVTRLVQEARDTFNFSKVSLSLGKDLITGYVNILTVEVTTSKNSYPFTIEKIYPCDLLINALVFK